MPLFCGIVFRMDIPITVPSDLRKRAAWILYHLKKRHLTLRELGRQNGCTGNAMRHAFFLPSYPQEKILADVIGLTVPELFPERYGAAGVRLHKVRGEKATAPTASRHGKKTRVA